MKHGANPLRWLVGFRDDLDLSVYWWHRLLKVLWLLGIFAYAAGAAWLLQFTEPRPARDNIEVIARLRDYSASRTDVPNAVPAFAALGSVGLLSQGGDGVDPWPAQPSLASQVFCSHALANYPAEQLAFIRANSWTVGGVPPQDLQLAQVEAWLAAAAERQGSIKPGSCLDPNDILPTDVDTVVAFRYTDGARLAAWLSRLVLFGLVLVALMLVTLNLYYRGVVYTMFGGRKIATPVTTPLGEDGSRAHEET